MIFILVRGVDMVINKNFAKTKMQHKPQSKGRSDYESIQPATYK